MATNDPTDGDAPASAPAPAAPEVSEELDATLAPGVSPFGLEPPSSEKYNPEKSRDKARAAITYWLLLLLTALFVGAFVAFFQVKEEPTFANLKSLLEMLISPLIVLVSAATGFYFGANSSNKSNAP